MTSLPGMKRKAGDIEQCEEICRLLKQQVEEALSAKRKATPARRTSPKAGQTVRETGPLLLLRLREANWRAHFELEEQKEQTKRAKAELDALNLKLQNLLYEEAHYHKEIQHCRDFRPREVVVDLVAEESVSMASGGEKDAEDHAHRLMNLRLEAELNKRKRLCKDVETFTARKAALQEANQTKRKFLHGLRGRLQQIAQAAEPAQQYFGHTTMETAESFEMAGQLPTPLYTLFAQVNAHKQAFDTGIGVSVRGDTEAALALNVQLERLGSAVATKLITENAEQTGKAKPFAVHPLAVLLHFPNGDDMAQGVALKLRFDYLYEINVVGVYVEHGDDALLFNLYPKDLGIMSPNPANRYLFHREIDIRKGYSGRTYRWAQWAAGLGFVQEESALSGPHVASIIDRIKGRIRDHRSLNTQLNLLAKGMIPGQSHAALHVWKEISLSEFQASELGCTTSSVGVTEGEAGPFRSRREYDQLAWHCYASRHFYVLLKKPDFELEGFVRVSMEYPYRPPEWKLRWRVYNGKRGSPHALTSPSSKTDAPTTATKTAPETALCDNQLKALEKRLNTAWDTKQGEESMLLSHQCLQLQAGFERLVEFFRAPAGGRGRTPHCGRARLAPLL